jgi:hypothetical protein
MNSRALATAVAILIPVTIAGCDGQLFWPRQKFEVQEWKATAAGNRYVFAKDLLDGKLIGLSASDIKARLGHPTSETPRILLYDIRESEPGTWQYIYVRLDENGRASKVGIGESD